MARTANRMAKGQRKLPLLVLSGALALALPSAGLALAGKVAQERTAASLNALGLGRFTPASVDPDLAALIGYAQHRPNLGNVEGQCPSVLLYRDDIDGLPAIDALLPGQADMLDAYVADQEAARAGLIGG